MPILRDRNREAIHSSASEMRYLSALGAESVDFGLRNAGPSAIRRIGNGDPAREPTETAIISRPA